MRESSRHSVLLLYYQGRRRRRFSYDTYHTYILVHCLRDPAIAYKGDDQHQNLAIIWRLSYTHCEADAGCGIDQKC